MEKREILLVLTVAGCSRWLIQALEGMSQDRLKSSGMDVLIVDDGTQVGKPSEYEKIEKYAYRRGFKLLGKEKPKGLTDSWNMAYSYFLSHRGQYKYCILSNDDVIFTENFEKYMISAIRDFKFDLISSLTDQPGVNQMQNVNKYIELDVNLSSPKQIQDMLIGRFGDKFYILPSNLINGFIMAFSHSIHKFKYGEDKLFNPKSVNIGNEDNLCQRIRFRGGSIGISLCSYVRHCKGMTLKAYPREALWTETHKKLEKIGMPYYS